MNYYFFYEELKQPAKTEPEKISEHVKNMNVEFNPAMYYYNVNDPDTPYGNHIWPSSIIMKRELKNISHIFNNARVLELGCGKAFTSVYFSIYNPSLIILSDGLEQMIESAPPDLPKPCKTKLLRYGNVLENEAPFDIILGSDIMYININIKEVCFTIKNSLAPKGSCYIFYNKREPDIIQPFNDELLANNMIMNVIQVEKDVPESKEEFFMLQITHKNGFFN
jgi:hypothetical protein